ncbi:MAG: AarF/UbiB family protein [Myxococcota bacterium]
MATPPFERAPAGLRARLSTLNRTRQVVQALLRHGFGSLVDQLGFSDGALSAGAGPRVSARLGRRLALTFADLGPTYVKLGQLLATREDLLPPEVAAELAPLQDRVAPLPERVVRQQIEACLGQPVSVLFSRFDGEPLASASIAQVHRACTADGREVVVKVRRPGIEGVVAEDLALLEQLAVLLEDRVEELRRLDPRGVARAFAESLTGELDLRREAAAYARMRQAVGATGRLPEVLEALSGDAVLTLEYLAGRKVTGVAGPARKALARAVLRSFVRQVLVAGYFHADPHPGNLLALDGGGIGLLDLGAVGVVTPATREALVRLAAAGAARDRRAFGEALLALTEGGDAVDVEAFHRDVDQLLDGILGRRLHDVALAELTAELFALLRTHGLRVRGDAFVLVRAVTLLDGVLRSLDPQMEPLRAAAPHVLWATVQRGELAPAARLGGALARARWRADRRVRSAAAAAGVGLVGLAAVAAAVCAGWL